MAEALGEDLWIVLKARYLRSKNMGEMKPVTKVVKVPKPEPASPRGAPIREPVKAPDKELVPA